MFSSLSSFLSSFFCFDLQVNRRSCSDRFELREVFNSTPPPPPLRIVSSGKGAPEFPRFPFLFLTSKKKKTVRKKKKHTHMLKTYLMIFDNFTLSLIPPSHRGSPDMEGLSRVFCSWL